MIRLGERRRIIVAIGSLIILSLAFWVIRGQMLSSVDSFAKCAEEGYPVTESNPPACHDGKHTFVGPLLTPAPANSPGESVSYELLVQGESGGTYPARQEVITNQADWQRYWREVHVAISPIPPILPVDFRTENVIAITEGQRMTGGYNLKITSIMSTNAGTSVNVTESVPTVTCAVTQAISNRYLIVRTARLPEPVTFRTTTDYRQC